jgi:hypothetical protein
MKYILSGFMCILFFNACVQDIVVELKSDNRLLLLAGEFTTDSIVHTVSLHRSGNLSTREFITGATIFITDGIDTFHYRESITPGFYQTLEKCCGIGGHIYKLFISNIDIDEDGSDDLYHCIDTMPVPVVFDSLVSKYELNDSKIAIVNRAYYNVQYNGADYLYPFAFSDLWISWGGIGDRLGSGEFSRFENNLRIATINDMGEIITDFSYFAIMEPLTVGATITFLGYNFTKNQYGFLKDFDKQTISGDVFQDNLYDQLRIPNNLPTNIKPTDKAAGFFFIYSVSRICKIFEE